VTSFENGYSFFRSSAAAFSGADSSGAFVESVDAEIDKLIRDLNSMEGFRTATDKLKGDAFEFWHAGTFNVNAALHESTSRVAVDRSHDLGSVDISSNFGTRFGLKDYSDGVLSAKAQAMSVFQRFKEYQSHGGQSSLDEYLAKNGYTDFDTILNDPIYSGQVRVIPKGQLEEAALWLRRMIATESSRRPEQVKRYEETLALLDDKLSDRNGAESIPLTEEDSRRLAELAKRGEADATELGLTANELFKYDVIIKQAAKAGLTAATISLVLKVAPVIYKAIRHLIECGEIDEEQYKQIGYAAVSGGAEGFVRGSVSAAITTCCKSGLLGAALKGVDPTFVATATVITMNTLKNAYSVAVGKKSRADLANDLIRDTYLSACSLIAGGVSQGLIHIPVLGYMLGSFVGSVFGSFTYDVGYKAAVSFCVDTGFTMFGLVKQDFVLPKEIIEQIGISTFDYETFEAETFKPESFQFESFECDTFEPETLGITYLRRGVIGVSRIGYTT
jgi:hypothetical protein